MSLDGFIGKWQEESKEGFDEFAASIGLTSDKTAFYKSSKTVISYNKDGDVWIIDVGVADVPNGRQFRFKMGEPYESANLDGTPMKSVINAQDGRFLETHKIAEMENEMQIMRQLQDSGKMLVTTTYKGNVMTSTYVRV
ncbi:fatty acid-binding protein, liver-like [Haliotis cracherodii]|uniref:fatty acid-binding protein homolog 6-like n=1 Tax=Haliotis rufescens TaxID=6454 RepID=UPI001EB06176|nr:fatty acid-binding protein homolog 6-like [Haliotis rufescens]